VWEIIDTGSCVLQYGDIVIGYGFNFIYAKGRENLGLGFEFKGAKELGNNFSLSLIHGKNPPGPVSFSNLKTK